VDLAGAIVRVPVLASQEEAVSITKLGICLIALNGKIKSKKLNFVVTKQDYLRDPQREDHQSPEQKKAIK
jgi:hypothetical protein